MTHTTNIFEIYAAADRCAAKANEKYEIAVDALALASDSASYTAKAEAAYVAAAKAAEEAAEAYKAVAAIFTRRRAVIKAEKSAK